jgi:hypothetical protein
MARAINLTAGGAWRGGVSFRGNDRASQGRAAGTVTHGGGGGVRKNDAWGAGLHLVSVDDLKRRWWRGVHVGGEKSGVEIMLEGFARPY